MYKMPTNLMFINKIMIFCENMLDEDIDGECFSEKLMFDLEFINQKLLDFWEEYLKYVDIYERDNFLKTYSFSLRRFKNILEKVVRNMPLHNGLSIDDNSINKILFNIIENIQQIKSHKNKIKIAGSEQQIINEEEYSLLFQKDDES